MIENCDALRAFLRPGLKSLYFILLKRVIISGHFLSCFIQVKILNYKTKQYLLISLGLYVKNYHLHREVKLK